MNITKGDKTNELMLKIIAFEKHDKFNPQEIYKAAKSYGISYGGWRDFIARLVSDNILNSIENKFTFFKDVRFKIYSKIRSPLYHENDISRISGHSELAYIGYLINNFILPTNISDYLSQYETIDFYISASKYVTIDNLKYMSIDSDKKSSFYDSRGAQFKKVKKLK